MIDLVRLWIRSEVSDDRGATMVEYGLLIVLIALVAAIGALALGGGLRDLFSRIDACLDGTAPGTFTC